MLRRSLCLSFVLFVATAAALSAARHPRPQVEGTIYVSSQGLYYDTFVVRDPLPMEGEFQLLESGVTEFGPGDPGYLGGRWWEDLNGNGMQDADDHFFLCPLLPPGRVVPLRMAMRVAIEDGRNGTQRQPPGPLGTIFVTGQGLYYDTFVAVDPLPMRGRFQLIANGETEFGPGDPGYLGGRWWEDVNGNGEQDAGDHFFLCPLLPPGRATP